jgi:nitroreductase
MDTGMSVPVSAVRTMVARARLAPSTHNTQPWSWTVQACPDDPSRACALELSRVRDRRLELTDPGGRELVISCGAALLTLRVAAAELLMDTAVSVLPDPARPDLLARVTFVEGSVDAAFSGLDAAVPVRHTWRRPFGPRKLPVGLLSRLEAEVADEGARLLVVTAMDVGVLAGLVRASESELYADRRRRAELARWLRPRWRGDGVPVTPLAVIPARLALRQGMAGRRIAARDAAGLLDAPAVVVLSTAQDGIAGWLAAGQGLQRLLLVAAAAGVAAGFANGPCQDARRRAALRELLGGELHPQVIMRLGFPAVPGRAVPRRSLEDLLVWPVTGHRGTGSDTGAAARSAPEPGWGPGESPDDDEDQLG